MQNIKLALITLAVFNVAYLMHVEALDTKENSMELTKSEELPKYLYKILSLANWKASQNQENLVLSPEDSDFIHFSKEDQLDRIIDKYWSESSQFVVLKINTSQLKGNLAYEANPGGSSKYYHLYHGSIPFSSIVESKIINR